MSARKTSPPAKPPAANLWPRLELSAALLLSLWIVVLHVIYLFHAGPLWRDEIGTMDFAAMPTVGDIWHNLQYDNFPPLFVFLARFWMALGLTSDLSLRLLGLVVGLGTVGVIWLTVRLLGARCPLLILALYACSPVAVRVGAALRPYGLGIALTLLSMGLIWKFIQEPKPKHLFLAMLAAVLSVQCLYQCAFFLVAFTFGAWVVTLSRKQKKITFQTGFIGAVASHSLLPHLGNIHKGGAWLVIAHVPVDFAGVWRTLNESLEADGPGLKYIWFQLFLIAVVQFLLVLRKKNWSAIYCGVVLLAATVFHLIFLRLLQLPLRTWYYLILLAVAALAMDVILAGLPAKKLKNFLVPLALIIAACACRTAYDGVQLRHTNLDLIAAQLKKSTQPGDMVLVSPWYYGVSFQRYYDTNNFVTVPPMTELRIHRYDLMRDAMDSPDPVGSLKTGIEHTLRSGHKLWVLGNFQFLQPGQAPVPLPSQRPASGGDSLYFSNWMLQLTTLVAAHVTSADNVPIPVPGNQPVDGVEKVTLLSFSGWHD